MDRCDLQSLWGEYTPRLAGFFRRNGVAPSAISDLAQECFLVLCRRYESVLEGKGGPFLYGIARNLLLAHRRKSYDAAATMSHLTQQAAGSPADSPNESPRDLAVQQEQSQKLLGAIEKLSGRQRQVIRLVHFQGFSRIGAAHEMGISREAVYCYEHRALESLRIRLDSLIAATVIQVPRQATLSPFSPRG